MNTSTDFFLASESELRARYPLWKEPLRKPVRRSAVNPFTGQLLEFESWDPDPADPVAYDGRDDPRDDPATPPIQFDGLGLLSVSHLIEVVMGSRDALQALGRPPLIGPVQGPTLAVLPHEFVHEIARLDARALERVAAAWSKLRRSDIATIGSDWTRDSELAKHDELGADFCSNTVVAFSALAKTAVSEGRLVFMRTWL